MSWTDPMNSETDYDKMPGHWLMARMGKRVLRPGGRELTEVMLRHLSRSVPMTMSWNSLPGLVPRHSLSRSNGPRRI